VNADELEVQFLLVVENLEVATTRLGLLSNVFLDPGCDVVNGDGRSGRRLASRCRAKVRLHCGTYQPGENQSVARRHLYTPFCEAAAQAPYPRTLFRLLRIARRRVGRRMLLFGMLAAWMFT